MINRVDVHNCDMGTTPGQALKTTLESKTVARTTRSLSTGDSIRLLGREKANGKVLIVSNNEPNRSLLISAIDFGTRNMSFAGAKYPAALGEVEKAYNGGQPFGVLVFLGDLPRADEIAAMKGFGNPIIVVSCPRNQVDEALALGADKVIPPGPHPDHLLRILSNLVG